MTVSMLRGAPVVGALLATCTAALAQDLTITGDLWRREVSVLEPILVTLTITNNTDAPLAIVPPYMDAGNSAPWPISELLVVDAASGERLRSATGDDNDRPYRPSGGAGDYNGPGYQQWTPGDLARAPRRAWAIPPRGAVAMPLDFLAWTRRLPPGRYHLGFRYAPDRGMLAHTAGEPTPAASVWEGSLEVQFGELLVREDSPDGSNGKALGLWRVLQPAGWIPPDEDYRLGTTDVGTRSAPARSDMLRYFPECAYAPHLLWYNALDGAMRYRRRTMGADPLAPPYETRTGRVADNLAELERKWPDYPMLRWKPLLELFRDYEGHPDLTSEELRACAEQVGDPKMTDLVEEIIYMRERSRIPAWCL